MTEPIYRLVNVYPASEPRTKVSGMLRADVYDYFFRHLRAGEHGDVQAILSILVDKFYLHCTTVIKLPKSWDPDNEAVLAKTLSLLNFNDTTALNKRIESLERELADARGATVGRRSDPSSPLNQPKPAAPKRVRGTAGSDRPQSQDNVSDTGKTKAGSNNRNSRAKDKESS